MHITFIGLGHMGHPIAANLLKAKFDLTVWNRTPARADDLIATGAKRAATLADASQADVVMTMLADDAAVEQVVFEAHLVERLPRGAIHVSMSTISVRLVAMIVAPLTAAVMMSLDAGHAGLASGVNNAVARVAGLFGVAVLGTITHARSPYELAAAFHRVMIAAAVLGAIGAVVARRLPVSSAEGTPGH